MSLRVSFHLPFNQSSGFYYMDLLKQRNKGLIMQNTRPVCTVTIIMCSQSTGMHIPMSQDTMSPLKIVPRTRGPRTSSPRTAGHNVSGGQFLGGDIMSCDSSICVSVDWLHIIIVTVYIRAVYFALSNLFSLLQQVQ